MVLERIAYSLIAFLIGWGIGKFYFHTKNSGDS